MSSIDFRASSSSGVRSWSDVPPSSFENVSQSFETCDDVVVAGERPEAAALLLGLPEDAARRGAAGRASRTARRSLPHVEVGEVDVVERRGRRATAPATVAARGDLVGHVVVARVRRLVGRRRRREPHEERAALLARLVDRQRLERRRREHVARPDVELRAVARADHDGPVELALRERALLVRARVVERDPRAVEPADADGPPAGLDPPEGALRQRRSAGPTSCQLAVLRSRCAGR